MFLRSVEYSPDGVRYSLKKFLDVFARDVRSVELDVIADLCGRSALL
jgi:hypothetical protein